MPSFPNTKRLWGFLWRVPDGWEDLGDDGGRITFVPPSGISRYVHWCGKKTRIGRELSDDTLFRYCPRCLTKLAETG